jgi:hypothetical protein
MAFVPEIFSLQSDIHELQAAIVIDAWLKPNHSLTTLQTILMGVTNTDLPFNLTKLADHQYLLLLPTCANKQKFLQDHRYQLHSFGYIPYQWNLRINRGDETKLQGIGGT